MGTPNWGRLFVEGRCKAIGVPFTDSELEEIKSGVSPKEIQMRVEVKKVEDTPKVEDKEVKKQLRQTLRDKGISFTNFESIETLETKLKETLI